VDLLYTGILLVWVYVIAAMPESAAMMTIVAVGGAGLLSGIWGGILFNSRVGWRWCLDFTALTTTWRQGKWALLGVIVVWLQNQGFLYLLNSLMGKVEVGNVSAIRLLLMPIVVMITSVGLILKPRGAEWLVSGNKRRLFWVTGGLTAGMVLLALVYIGGVFSVQKMIMDLLFKKTIADIDYLLPLWGLVFVLQIVRTNISTLFQIFQRFDILFYIGLVTAIVSLITGYWGILTMGVIGSLFGLILGEVMYLLGCVMVYIFDQRRRNMTLQTISWDHV
jgi:O-antigen/teichoic acid export membrane protein